MTFRSDVENVALHCWPGRLLGGLTGRAGSYVDALGGLCAAAPNPNATAQAQQQQQGSDAPLKPIHITGAGSGANITDSSMVCTGGNMSVGPLPNDTTGKYVYISFGAAPQAAVVASPGAGQCAWGNRPLAGNEGKRLALALTSDDAQRLVQAAKNGGTFIVEGRPLATVAIMVTKIDSVQVAAAATGGPVFVPASQQGGGGSSAGGGSALQPPIADGDDSGTPTTIARAVNVHTETNSGGRVLGSLSAGTQVTNLGCSKGWCHISFAGGDGWVGQTFLN
jgi:hypothetical protein